MVQYGRPTRSSWRKSVRPPSCRTVMGKVIRERFIGIRLGKSSKLRMLVCKPWKGGLFLSVYVDDIKLAGTTQNIDPMCKVLVNEVDLGEPTSFLDHVCLECTQRECATSKDIVENCMDMFESKISAGSTEKPPCSGRLDSNIPTWSCDLESHAKKGVERCCELANKTTQQLFKVSTPCLVGHHF